MQIIVNKTVNISARGADFLLKRNSDMTTLYLSVLRESKELATAFFDKKELRALIRMLAQFEGEMFSGPDIEIWEEGKE